MPDEAENVAENVEIMRAKLSRLSIEKEEAELATAAMGEQLAAATRRAEAAEARLREIEAERSTDAPESLPPVPAPAAPPAPPQTPLTIKECLSRPGLYIYHVKCLTVHRVDMPDEEWCVVKVGRTNNIGEPPRGRIITERNEIRRYRGLPRKLRITAEDLDLGDDDVGDLVALFTGADWNNENYEKDMRKMGLPLGKGIVDDESVAVQQMSAQHSSYFGHSFDGRGRGGINVLGWQKYLNRENIPLRDGSKVGLSELIMMPKEAMLRLRRAFKSNPAAFADASEDGPAWASVNEAKSTLHSLASDQGMHVIVQFNPHELTFAKEDVSKLKVGQMRRLLGYPENHRGSMVELKRECDEAVARSLAHQDYTEALAAYAASSRAAADVEAFSQRVGAIFGGMTGVDAFRPSQERVAELIPPLRLELRRDPS